MSYNPEPPPYQGGPNPNIHGPAQYPGGQPYASQPYMGPPQMAPAYGGGGGGGAPIIIMNNQQQQQQQQQQQSTAPVIVQSSGVNHGLCCLICFLTSGLSLPCWIVACLSE